MCHCQVWGTAAQGGTLAGCIVVILFRKGRLLAPCEPHTVLPSRRQCLILPFNHAKNVTRVYEPAVLDTAPTTASNLFSRRHRFVLKDIVRCYCLPELLAGRLVVEGRLPPAAVAVRGLLPRTAAATWAATLTWLVAAPTGGGWLRRLSSLDISSCMRYSCRGRAGHWISRHGCCEPGHLTNWKWQQAAVCIMMPCMPG